MICEVTGAVELGAHVALEAFAHGKDVVLMNAELEATIGPILDVYADRHGVILSACDGDEPGVQLNLYRWVKGLGLEPRVIGNVKGLQDPYRNPDDAEGVRRDVGPEPRDGDVVRGRLEDLVRAGDRGERDGLHRAAAWDVARPRVPRRRDDDRSPLRRRGGAGARRHRRLCRRHATDQGLRARGARRPEAAALPQSLQDGRGPALLVLHPLPPRPLRGAERDRTRRPLPRPRLASPRRPGRRGLRGREARPPSPGDAWTTTAST